MTQEELLRMPTLTMGDTEVGEPSPRRLQLTPAQSNASLGKAPANNHPEGPDAGQAVIYIPPSQSQPCSPTQPEADAVPPESWQDAQPRSVPGTPIPVETPPNTQDPKPTPQGPQTGASLAAHGVPPKGSHEKKKIELQGTMYTDGTYWKRLCCMFSCL